VNQGLPVAVVLRSLEVLAQQLPSAPA